MKAKVTKAFPGVRDGQIYPERFKPGDIVEGDLAEVAVEQKWAERINEAPAPLLARQDGKTK